MNQHIGATTSVAEWLHNGPIMPFFSIHIKISQWVQRKHNLNTNRIKPFPENTKSLSGDLPLLVDNQVGHLLLHPEGPTGPD